MKKLLTLLMATIMMFALATTAMAADVSTEAALKDALSKSGDYTLTDNIELNESITIPEGVEVTLNTNDFTITYDPTDDTEVEWAIYNEGSLTITGVSTTNEVTYKGGGTSFAASDFTVDESYEFVLADQQSQGFFYSTNYLEMSDVTVYSSVANAFYDEDDDGVAEGNDYYYGGHMIYSDGGSLILNNVNSLSMCDENEGGISALRADTGTETFTANGGYYLHMGKATSYGGAVGTSYSSGHNPYAFTSNADYGIINPDMVYGYRGGLGVNNGYSEILGGYYKAVIWHTYYFSGDKGTVECVIKGGTFEPSDTYYSGQEAIYIANQNTGGDGGVNATAACEITGGTFNGYISLGTTLGSLSISGGEFATTKVDSATIFDYTMETGDVAITLIESCTLNAPAIMAENVTLTIPDGVTFTVPDNYFAADGEIVTDGSGNISGTYVDDSSNYVAKSGTRFFTSFADALSTVTSGTITLLQNVDLSESAEIESGATLYVPEGITLSVADGETLTNNGTLSVDGTLSAAAATVLNNATYKEGENASISVGTFTHDDSTSSIYIITAEQLATYINEKNLIWDGVTLTLDADLTIPEGTTLTVFVGADWWNDLVVPDGITLTVNGTLTNKERVYIEEGGTLEVNGTFVNTNGNLFSNAGTIVDNGTITHASPASNFSNEGTIAVSTQEKLVAAMALGDTIEIRGDINLTSDITISTDVTIKGATGAETISGTGNNTMFTIDADVDVTFDSVGLDITKNGIEVTSAGDGSTVTVKNCTIDSDEDGATYIVYGDTNVNTDGGDYHYDLTFTGNTVTGQFGKPLHTILGEGNYLTVTGNSFTGKFNYQETMTSGDTGYTDYEANAEANRSISIQLTSADSTVIITGNEFSNIYKAISIDKWEGIPSLNITGNTFTEVMYAVDLNPDNTYNQGLSFAYNFFDLNNDGAGELMQFLDSEEDDDHMGSGTVSEDEITTAGLTLYPYYSDSALTTLVYEDGEKDVETAVADALDTALSTDATSDDLAAAIEIVTAVDNSVIVDNDMVDLVNDLDEALLASYEEDGTGTLKADASITTVDDEDITNDTEIDDDDLKVSEGADTEVKGLALAVVGNDTIAENTTVTVTLNIAQTAASATTEVDEDGNEATTIAVAYEISPTKTVGDGINKTTTDVANEEISAPITFTLHLPSIFDDTNRATLTHDGVDKGTYVVYHDGSDSYIIVTTTHFSEFVVTLADSVSTSSSSVKKYSNDLEVGDGGSAYATPLSASSGTTVYINVTPDTGYEVDEVIVDGGDITVTDCEDGSYSYKQPAYAVDIEVTFQADGTVEEEEVEEEVDETEALTDFDDVVAGAWYEEYVAAAVEEGIMQGNSTTEFAPNGTTTRAMMIQVLFNMSDEPETENDEAAWYSEALAWGMEFGITDGTDITGNLTREQLVTMLYRYAMSNGVDVSIGEDTNILSYNDALEVADWAMEAFQWACGEGIINGDTDGNLNPQGNATRAELAKIMVSYLGE